MAMAARWSTVLVLQPRLASAARALPTAASVRMSRGLRSAASTCMTFSPLSLAKRMRSLYTAGIVPLPGSAMPITSARQFMELAVNMPEHEPQVGQALHSMALRPSSSSLPAWCWPTASKTLLRSSVRPSRWPASIAPPPTMIDGTLSRIAAMSMPGTILSQHGTRTRASKAWAMVMDSTVSAMSSRLGSE